MKIEHGIIMFCSFQNCSLKTISCAKEIDDDKKRLYEELYFQIKLACIYIEQGDFCKATSIYSLAIAKLYNKYNLK